MIRQLIDSLHAAGVTKDEIDARLAETGHKVRLALQAKPTDEEIEADLKEAGIDMEPAYRRLHALVEGARAKLAAEHPKCRKCNRLIDDGGIDVCMRCFQAYCDHLEREDA